MNRQALGNFYRLAAFWAAGLLASGAIVALTPPKMNPYTFVAGFWVGVAVFFVFMVYAIDWNVDSVDETKETKEDEDD